MIALGEDGSCLTMLQVEISEIRSAERIVFLSWDDGKVDFRIVEDRGVRTSAGKGAECR